MSKTDFQSEDLKEPRPGKQTLYGLSEAAEAALRASEEIIGHKRRSLVERDTRRVRGLAAHVLKTVWGDRYSWPDVTFAIWKHRSHSTAISAANKWKGDPRAARAIELYRLWRGVL